MWSEAIILFLKQPDLFFRILEGKNPIRWALASGKDD